MTVKPLQIWILCCTTLFISCGNQEERPTFKDAELNKMAWLAGTWQDAANGGVSEEIWKKADEQSMDGFSYFMVGKDTASSETMNISRKENKLVYAATVKDQNDGKPVEYMMTSTDSNQLIFENPMHDFPKKIIYKKITNDSLVVQLEGLVDSVQEVQEYPMKRKK